MFCESDSDWEWEKKTNFGRGFASMERNIVDHLLCDRNRIIKGSHQKPLVNFLLRILCLKHTLWVMEMVKKQREQAR